MMIDHLPEHIAIQIDENDQPTAEAALKFLDLVADQKVQIPAALKIIRKLYPDADTQTIYDMYKLVASEKLRRQYQKIVSGSPTRNL